MRNGLLIPAHPLALTARRRLDERRQRALTRYYVAAGAGGLAVGVHTTQFAIHDPRVGLYDPVLELAAASAIDWADRLRRLRPVLIAGIAGPTRQAVKEAGLALEHGYQAGLLSPGGLARHDLAYLLERARRVAEVIPIVGFYLQPAVGGRALPYTFWRRFLDIENVVAIKVAPFDRYRTLDVVRAVAESGRAGEIALYTGNDDHIIFDLLATHRVGRHRVRFVGGLLGQWAIWTRRAARYFAQCREIVRRRRAVPPRLRALASDVTAANAVVFDAAHGFAGCLPGIHEVLRRQGLLAGTWCLDPKEILATGQRRAIARLNAAYPQLSDDAFVTEHRDAWLS